ncbi:MAG: NAD+ synthase [Methanomicrobiales archaeon]|nr:NAD+ synthase [Methanomicrobiales archaeon]
MTCDWKCEKERIEQMVRRALWESGCEGVVVGLSGGVDSAVAFTLCAGAVGKEQVKGLMLPSAVSREEDLRDAETLCRSLGIPFQVIPIQPVLDSFHALPGITDSPYLSGNLMARIRMAILYYFANREHRLVCGTSNRSEYMLGYCTKFGDNAADIQPILHLYKREVYEFARSLGVPEPILTKTPSAGLWVGQSDEGEIGLTYAEIDASLEALEKNGWNATTSVEERVLALVKKSQHKRSPAVNLRGYP